MCSNPFICKATQTSGIKIGICQVPDTPVSKEGHADSLLGYEGLSFLGPITLSFLEKRTTVNSASYCQLRHNSPYLSNNP